MAYVVVHYLPFLSAAATLGLLVGWWAMGSRRRRVAEDELAANEAGEEDAS